MRIGNLREKMIQIKWVDVFISLAIVLSPVLQQHKGFFLNGAWTIYWLLFPSAYLRCSLLPFASEGAPSSAWVC